MFILLDNIVRYVVDESKLQDYEYEIIDDENSIFVLDQGFFILDEDKKLIVDDFLKEELKIKVVELADLITDYILKTNLKYKAYGKQLERYELKYEAAKAGKFSDELNQEIITNYETSKAEISELIVNIELLREALTDLIDVNIPFVIYIDSLLRSEIRDNRFDLIKLLTLGSDMISYIDSKREELLGNLEHHIPYEEKINSKI